jgi:hypothetical protein
MKEKNEEKFMFEELVGGLKGSPIEPERYLQVFKQKYMINLFKIFVIYQQSLDPDPDPAKCLDPEPDSAERLDPDPA